MRLQISTLPLLAALAVMASQRAAAHVMAVGTATIEVSAVVVASCRIDTGTGTITPGGTIVSCNGDRPGNIAGSLASDLSNPTADEQAASAATRAVTITY